MDMDPVKEKNFANIALNIPIDKYFCYSVPENLKKDISIGKRVLVSFGNRITIGYVTGFSDSSEIKHIKPIDQVLDQFPVIDFNMLKLAEWISRYYCAPIGLAISLVLPAALKKMKSQKNMPPPEKTESSYHDPKHILSKGQGDALLEISEGLNKFNVFLLHGITASGKTEVYIKSTEEVIESGKEAIVLVPEIALTPQTLGQFESRFKDKVAIMHSRLSETKRFSEWLKCFQGKAKVVVGARSALFAPFKNLGLIIIDEEHEPSYKEMTLPKYNARNVAIKRCEIENCPVILGSATPSLESYYKAKNKEYKLLELKERIQKRMLPEVKIVDMSTEFEFKRKSILFSRLLLKELEKVIEKCEQAILFLNRRGFSTHISCKACGYVFKCKKCESIMVYHSSASDAVCHYCNFKDKIPKTCPKCSSSQLKFSGMGTEKVESEIARLFPKAKVARMDTDITKKRGMHDKILSAFKKREIDILVGTQMIAKGLDFPDVTLIGVISSDINLNIPDFRASERTFNLLTQVAGRSGRGKKAGLVIVQTYSPKHYSIILSSNHDYESFYKKELKFRKELNLPPFTSLIKISLSASKSDIAENASIKLKNLIKKEALLKDEDFLGPAPGVISKIRNKFIWNIFLKTKDVYEVSVILRKILGDAKVFEKAYINIDVDPV